MIKKLGRLIQEDHKFKDSLDYIVRPCLQSKNKDRQKAWVKSGAMGHAYNTSYSVDRDLKDWGLRLAWAKS
jgi:hypothetical protein